MIKEICKLERNVVVDDDGGSNDDGGGNDDGDGVNDERAAEDGVNH